MKRLILFLLVITLVGLASCGDQPKQTPAQTPDVSLNPNSVAGMNLKGPVKTMVKRVYTANIWEETRYEFAPDGHLTTIVQDKSSCGDQMIVHFDASGAVVDTTYDLSGGCYDPADELNAMPPEGMPDPEVFSGEFSEATSDHFISAKFNDQHAMTDYHANDGKADLTAHFLYEEDQTTLKELRYELSDEDGNISREIVIPQVDEHGNPIQWAVGYPTEPFPVEILSMTEEFFPALYVETASYEYYK